MFQAQYKTYASTLQIAVVVCASISAHQQRANGADVDEAAVLAADKLAHLQDQDPRQPHLCMSSM